MFNQGIPLNKTVFDQLRIELEKEDVPVPKPQINQDG